MTSETLKQANLLSKQIKIYENALSSFVWMNCEGIDSGLSRNPKIIIEFDDFDGRDQIALPMALNEELVDVLKNAIIRQLGIATQEFIEL